MQETGILGPEASSERHILTGCHKIQVAQWFSILQIPKRQDMLSCSGGPSRPICGAGGDTLIQGTFVCVTANFLVFTPRHGPTSAMHAVLLWETLPDGVPVLATTRSVWVTPGELLTLSSLARV